MEQSVKRSLFFFITCLLQIQDLVLTYSRPCVCETRALSCDDCSYNLTFKGKTTTLLPLCCSNNTIQLTEMQMFTNVTLVEVDIVKHNICNFTSLNFNLSFLDTIAITIENSSLIDINIYVKPTNLRVINLSSNKLPYINKGTFNSYLNLIKLVLSKNEIKNIFEGSFNGLLKLESLDLSENKLTKLQNVFSPLKNLQHLNLSRNNIEFLHENYFNNWLLQHLDISYNNLKKVAPGALQLLPNLARLFLTDNPHLGITQLDTQLLVGTGRRLQQIDVSRTGLYQVPEAFTHSVRFLTLVGNKIPAVRCGDLDSYPLLQSLDFSENKIVSIEDDSVGRLEMLLFLNLNKNLLTAIPMTLPNVLKYLSISNNLIRNLTKLDFKNMPNLKILLLQNNQIRFIQNHVLDDLLSLEILDLSNNPITTLTASTFDGPLSLKDLRLCFLNVSITENEDNFPISSPESIQMLHLQASPTLARLLLADSAALAALSHLQYLDLRMNNLSGIRRDLLFYLVQLKTLRLHGNSINCSAELWLREWMTWNKSLSQNETCYYSTPESKEDDMKYNCTFSESFTINESLPPVNLYSTEMINKLLRYYGYLNNKTEQAFTKTLINKTRYENIDKKQDSYNGTIQSYEKWDESRSSKYSNKAQLAKNERINNFEQNFLLSDHHVNNNVESNADLKNEDKPLSFSTDNEINSRTWVYSKKNKTGRRLNTPLNNTKPYNMEYFYGNDNKIKSTIKSEYLSPTDNFTKPYSMKKVKSAWYQRNERYLQFFGTSLVLVLIIAAVLLWVSFRLRYKRRCLQVEDRNIADQIEVSYISGGVLW